MNVLRPSACVWLVASQGTLSRGQRRAATRPDSGMTSAFMNDFMNRMKALGGRFSAPLSPSKQQPPQQQLSSGVSPTKFLHDFRVLEQAMADEKPAERLQGILEATVKGLAEAHKPLAGLVGLSISPRLAAELILDENLQCLREELRPKLVSGEPETSENVMSFLSALALCASRVGNPTFAVSCTEAILDLNEAGSDGEKPNSELRPGFLSDSEKRKCLARLAGHLNARGSHSDALEAARKAVVGPDVQCPEAITQGAFALVKLERHGEALQWLERLKTVKKISYQVRNDATSIRTHAEARLKEGVDPVLSLPEGTEMWVSLPALVKLVPDIGKHLSYHGTQSTVKFVTALVERFSEKTSIPAKLFVGYEFEAVGEDGSHTTVLSSAGTAEEHMVQLHRESGCPVVGVVALEGSCLKHLNHQTGPDDQCIQVDAVDFWTRHLAPCIEDVETVKPKTGTPLLDPADGARHPVRY